MHRDATKGCIALRVADSSAPPDMGCPNRGGRGFAGLGRASTSEDGYLQVRDSEVRGSRFEVTGARVRDQGSGIKDEGSEVRAVTLAKAYLYGTSSPPRAEELTARHTALARPSMPRPPRPLHLHLHLHLHAHAHAHARAHLRGTVPFGSSPSARGFTSPPTSCRPALHTKVRFRPILDAGIPRTNCRHGDT